MTSTSENAKTPPGPKDVRSPPLGFVEVGTYELLVDARDVIGPLADEMPVWCKGRPVGLGSGVRPTDLEDVRIWVPAADAERARHLLAKLAPPPPTQEDFEREGASIPSKPRGASAIRWLLAPVLAFVGLIGVTVRCGH